MKLGIKSKIMSFILILLAFTMSLLSIMVIKGEERYEREKIEEFLSYKKTSIEKEFYTEYRNSSDDKAKNLQNFGEYIYHKHYFTNPRAIVYDMSGHPLLDIDYAQEVTTRNSSKIINTIKSNHIIYTIKNHKVYYYFPLQIEGSIEGFVEFDYQSTDLGSLKQNTQRLFLVFGIISMVIGSGIAYVYFSKLVGDISKLNKWLQNIPKSNKQIIEPLARKDEIGELSQGIAKMNETIQKSINDLDKERTNLQLAVNKLELMTKEQREFFGTITHEFKTPLASIRAYADLLTLYQDLDLSKEAGENILLQANRLTSMVDKILNLSYHEQYEFELELEEIDIKPVLEDVCTMMENKANKHHIHIERHISSSKITADKNMMHHVFINLIDNAIKYNNPHGKISIKNWESDGRSIIEIKDTGIGIAEKHTQNIFKPFYRVDRENIEGRGGTGLGLALVDKFVRRQGGHIELVSSDETGSVFRISCNLSP